MKAISRLMIPLLLIIAKNTLYAQVAINNTAAPPNASAMLDVSSTTKGFLGPRVTTLQRTAIVSPADGLWVYDTDTKGFWYFKSGTGWQQIAISPVALTLPYSAIFNSPSTLFALTNTGTGMALSGSSTGNTGVYGSTGTISGAGLLADNTAGGEAVTGRTLSGGGTPTGAVVGRNDGPGYGVSGFIATDASGTGIGVLGRVGISGSKGIAGHFENLNSANAGTALEAVTNGTGSGLTVSNTNSTNTTNILNVTTNGPGVIPDHSLGNAGNFFINNTSGVGAGVRGEVNSIFGNNGTAGVYGIASGTGGYGGYFEHSNASGFGYTLYATTAGQGGCGYFTNTSSTNSQPVLQSYTIGTGSAAVFANTNTTNTTNILNVTSNGPGVIPDHSQGNAGNFFMNNTSGVGAGVRGEVNSIFGNNGTAGVYGTASGTGGYGGYFEHSNASGFGYAFYATTAGLGSCGIFNTGNSSNGQPTLQSFTNGTGNAASFANTNNTNTTNTLTVTSNGPGVISDHSQGNAGNFFMNNTSGVGAGVRGEVNSIFGNNGTAGVYGTASGTGGYGGYFEHSNASGFGISLYANTSGQGVCTHLETLSSTNSQPTLQTITNGTGNAATFANTNNTNTTNTVNVTSNGPGVIGDHSQGNAGNFFMNNTSGVGAGVRGEVNSIFGNNGTAGVYGTASGTGGYGGYFEHSNASGFGYAFYATTAGLGSCGIFNTSNSSNTQPTLQSFTNGTGNAASFANTNNTNTSNTLNVTSNGPGVIGDHSQGNSGNFFMNNTSGVGAGVRGEVNSIFGNNGTAGVYGVASGTGGYGGYFEHTETTGFGIALQVVSNDHGTAMVVDHEGDGNLAIFSRFGGNKVRFDNTGKGFFNGGTQSSGADLAEAFDVEGSTKEYEPGDVLQISVTADRTVIKSNEAYSSLVVGVYATKPGVLLTEESIDGTMEGKVPMGVIGVIPTKVCNENGPVHRGDILVSASKAGYAMKADLGKLKPGQSIGKALEDFNGEAGKIKVLVNVR